MSPAAYSNGTVFSSGKSRYNELNIKVSTIDIVHRLDEAGLIGRKDGWQDSGGKGFLTRIWPTPKLTKLFEDAAFGFFDIGYADNRETIILRDEDKVDVPYDDTPVVRDMRQLLHDYNKLLNASSLCGSCLVPDGSGRCRRLHRQTDWLPDALTIYEHQGYVNADSLCLSCNLAMLDAWNADSCVGNYLKTIFESGQRKGQKQGKPRKPTDFLTTNFRSYAGFFHTEYYELRDRKIMAMQGYGGQHIWIDFDNSRIVSVNAIHANYNWRKLIAGVIKKGKISSGNWN